MLSEDQVPKFVEWAKSKGIEFRRFEVKRANKKPTKVWQLLFKIFKGK